MGTKSSVTNGNWSDSGTWDYGVPADGDDVYISFSHKVLMDVDQSSFVGLSSVSILGSGILYFANGTNGYLKIRTGGWIDGTSTGEVRGRLSANSDGERGNTTPLQASNSGIIDLQGTASIAAGDVDIELYCTEPDIKYVETYLQSYGPVDQVTYVTPDDDYIDWDTTLPSNATAVKVRSTGILPSGLYEEDLYYTRSSSGTKCKLALQNYDNQIVDITHPGSGNITMYTGHSNTGTKTINVVQDVTGDTAWKVGSPVALCDIGPTSYYDQQRDSLAVIASGSLTLTNNNINSAQFPLSRIYLLERNVAIRSNSTSTTHNIVAYPDYITDSGIFNCEIRNTYQPGSTTTFYSRGIAYGQNHIINGILSGLYHAVHYSDNISASGIFIANSTALYRTDNSEFYGKGCGNGNLTYDCDNCDVDAEICGCTYPINGGIFNRISGLIHGCSVAVYVGVSHLCTGKIVSCNDAISGDGDLHTFNGIIRGCGDGLYLGFSYTLNGIIEYGAYGVRNGAGHYIGGIIRKCGTGIYYGQCTAHGAILEDNTYDLRAVDCKLYSTQLNSSTPFYAFSQEDWPYNGTNILGAFSFDHAGDNGALRWYCQGGTGSSIAYDEGTHGDLQVCGWSLPDPDWIYTSLSIPASLPYSESTPAPNWIDIPINTIDGETIVIECAVKPSVTTDWILAPTIQLIDKGKTWGEEDQVIEEDSHSLSDTDWELLTVSYSATSDRQLFLRILSTQDFDGEDSFQWCWRQKLDYPAVADVESGVSYGNTVYTGTLVATEGGVVNPIFISNFIK